jgi:hypothetical protein
MFTQIDKRLRQIRGPKYQDIPFGGVNILVLGDFKQLQPVGSKWIFGSDGTDNAYEQLQCERNSKQFTNSLWQLFEMLELTQFMRQNNDLAFAEALETLGTKGLIGLNDTQLKLFNSRIIQENDVTKIVNSSSIPIPPDCVFLFHENDRVSKFNSIKVENMIIRDKENVLFENRAENVIVSTNEKGRLEAIDWLRKNPNGPPGLAGNLINLVQLKVNLKYMLTRNMDQNDGLVNGTTGTLKYIMFPANTARESTNHEYANVCFFDFYEIRIGKNARESFIKKYGYLPDLRKILHNQILTPIFRCEQKMKLRGESNWHIIKKQFPFELNEASTIHKCQGQTLNAVALDLIQQLTRSLLYVALSRVRKVL